MKMAIVHIPAQIVIKMNIINLGISGIRSGALRGLYNPHSELKYLIPIIQFMIIRYFEVGLYQHDRSRGISGNGVILI